MDAAHGGTNELKPLIDAVLKDPGAVVCDRSVAADELVSYGKVALLSIQRVLDGHWQSDAHPKDVMEAFMYIASRIHARG
jgi:hypothetical protein